MRKYNEIQCVEFTNKFLKSPNQKSDGLLYLVAQNSIENNNCGYFVQMLKDQLKTAPAKVKEILGDNLLNDLNKIYEPQMNIIKEHWGSFNDELYNNYLVTKLNTGA
jgi:hypothetical protein